ncbi:MAG TPA: helix-turn-helix domain-containing protein [Verrucomicrobiae bacterium]
MKCLLPHAQISSSSRRRLARCLVGLSLKAVERDMILETLAHTCGNRTVAARLLGVSARTLRNKIAQYSLEHRTTSNTGGSPPSIGTSPQRMEAGTRSSVKDKGSAMSVALARMRRSSAWDGVS